eukprot:m.247373 g.247373  ORF g.247373 m.247373 type:complete len:84 (-) comp26448_c0_seq4:87-338(-)
MMHSALSTLTVIIIITMRQTTVAAAAVIPYADIIAEIYGGVVGIVHLQESSEAAAGVVHAVDQRNQHTHAFLLRSGTPGIDRA